MSYSIKRITWERLDYIESVDFMLIPKGHELFYTLKPDVGDEVELGDIEGDLADFFFYHIGQSYPHEFAFPGQLIQDQEDKLYANYYYYVEPEIDLSEDTKGKFLITALPLIEKLNGEEFNMDEVELTFCSENGKVTDCDLEIYNSDGESRKIKIDNSIKLLIHEEIRKFIEPHFQDAGNEETIEIFGSYISVVKEHGEYPVCFEIVEDEDWEKNYN